MPNNSNLYLVLGQITFTYNRIDFLISLIAKDLGIVENSYEFFSKQNFKSKIDTLKKSIGLILEKQIRDEFMHWLNTLDMHREDRNVLIHSIILENSEYDSDYLIFNYKEIKSSTSINIRRYSFQDLEKLNKDFIEFHNEGYLIWQKIKKLF